MLDRAGIANYDVGVEGSQSKPEHVRTGLLAEFGQNCLHASIRPRLEDPWTMPRDKPKVEEPTIRNKD